MLIPRKCKRTQCGVLCRRRNVVYKFCFSKTIPFEYLNIWKVRKPFNSCVYIWRLDVDDASEGRLRDEAPAESSDKPLALTVTCDFQRHQIIPCHLDNGLNYWQLVPIFYHTG